jgi:16S rRNA (guanine(966)-N(2))-methyltransferase RsmD
MKKDNRLDKKIKSFTTNIIAGKYKGKKIEIPDISTTRSSKSILKESFFNSIQFEIIDRNFVEVFAGSGSIGLEALSRGANKCYFMEQNKIAFKFLEHNIKNIAPNDAQAIYGDSFENFSTVYKLIKKQNIKTYFYFDPPFSIRDGMDDIYDKTLNLIASIEPEVCQLVVIEHMTGIELPDKIGKLSLDKSKKFGKSTTSYYLPN